MADFVINVQGERETIAKIKAFDMKRKKQAMAVVKKSAAAVKKQARSTVPVSPAGRKKTSGRPGDLKSSIKHKYYFQGLGAMVLPDKPKGSHRAIVEYGTKNRRNRGRVKPHPFMAPAKASQETYYNNSMKKIWEGTDEFI